MEFEKKVKHMEIIRKMNKEDKVLVISILS
jgi:hypothetical protein